MIYVTSDLHGCSVETLQRLLALADFCDDDFLFVLGDVIDRGEHGAALLLWLTEQPNVQLILGNHEAMLLSCGFLFREVSEDSLADLDTQKLALYQRWMKNGAAPTLTGLNALVKRDPELLEGIFDYLRDAPLYEMVRAGGQRYLLVHAGLDNFRPDRHPDDYDLHDLVWARPTLETRYFDHITTVFGHTPTEFLDEASRGRALKTDTWICIDTGAACGGTPMLLRLDDEAKFYL